MSMPPVYVSLSTIFDVGLVILDPKTNYFPLPAGEVGISLLKMKRYLGWRLEPRFFEFCLPTWKISPKLLRPLISKSLSGS